MKFYNPKLSFAYEALLLLAVSLALAWVANAVNPKGINWPWEPERVQPAPFVAKAQPTPQPGAEAHTDPAPDSFDTGGFDQPTPGVSEIDTDRALALHAAGEALFVDARYPEDFEAGNIAGALNIPPGMFEDEIEARLGDVAKDAAIVIYCSSVHCPLSHDLADSLAFMGFTNLMVYPAGYEGWTQGQGPVGGLS